jgi:hypothetical protein
MVIIAHVQSHPLKNRDAHTVIVSWNLFFVGLYQTPSVRGMQNYIGASNVELS